MNMKKYFVKQLYFISFILGFSTALLMRDVYYLNNTNKLKMAVSDYYNDDKEKMPIIIKELFTKFHVKSTSL